MCACRAALARRYKIVGYGVKPHVQKWAHLNDGTVELVRAACAATLEWRNGATCHHRTRRRQSFYPSAHARTDLCAPGNASFLHFSIPSKGYGALPHVCPWPLTFRARMPKTRNLQLPPNFTALPTGGAAPQTETVDCCAPLFSCRPWNRSAAQFTGRPFSFDICKPALRPCRPRLKPAAQPKGRYCGYLRFAERLRLPGL